MAVIPLHAQRNHLSSEERYMSTSSPLTAMAQVLLFPRYGRIVAYDLPRLPTYNLPSLLMIHLLKFGRRQFFGEGVAGRVRTRSTTTRGQKSAISGRCLHRISRILSSVDFLPFSPGLLCNLVRKWPQNVDKIARFPGGETSVESCHVCGCHGVFGPEGAVLFLCPPCLC